MIIKILYLQHVEGLIQGLGLEAYANTKIKGYSGGTKRKLSTAIAMLGNPKLVMLVSVVTSVKSYINPFIVVKMHLCIRGLQLCVMQQKLILWLLASCRIWNIPSLCENINVNRWNKGLKSWSCTCNRKLEYYLIQIIGEKKLNWPIWNIFHAC